MLFETSDYRKVYTAIFRHTKLLYICFKAPLRRQESWGAFHSKIASDEFSSIFRDFRKRGQPQGVITNFSEISHQEFPFHFPTSPPPPPSPPSSECPEFWLNALLLRTFYISRIFWKLSIYLHTICARFGNFDILREESAPWSRAVGFLSVNRRDHSLRSIHF